MNVRCAQPLFYGSARTRTCLLASCPRIVHPLGLDPFNGCGQHAIQHNVKMPANLRNKKNMKCDVLLANTTHDCNPPAIKTRRVRDAYKGIIATCTNSPRQRAPDSVRRWKRNVASQHRQALINGLQPAATTRHTHRSPGEQSLPALPSMRDLL